RRDRGDGSDRSVPGEPPAFPKSSSRDLDPLPASCRRGPWNVSIREERQGSEIPTANAPRRGRIPDEANRRCDGLSEEFRDVYKWHGKWSIPFILGSSIGEFWTVTAADEQDKPSDVQSKDASEAEAANRSSDAGSRSF